ncbi:MAG: hypothetical protein A3A17_03455 [Candidatus Ryanbacteria bacterium RIFCSPLOWO2_01_FULL_44_230]|nr:MAG: hypothetical protein A3A17_03455 [Candidatus Ryanbacteria bacterium RIFCSPLOWO2_01_FULL_44_230]
MFRVTYNKVWSKLYLLLVYFLFLTMNNVRKVEWVLRISVAGEFVGHGVFALQGRKAWVEWFSIFGISDVGTATTFLWLVGLIDVLLAVSIAGDSIFEFVERWANWGAPLALLLLRGIPTSIGGWLPPKQSKAGDLPMQ